jgi:uncharacterized protein (DUF2336 family)
MSDCPSNPNRSLDGLFDLACRSGVDIRPTLLRVLTDLYVQKPDHSAAEEAQYVELALRLIESVDAATRLTVVARLTGYPRAPEAVLQRLAAYTGCTVTPADVPLQPADPAGLFFTADSETRRAMMLNAPPAPPQRPVAVDDTVARELEAAALARNPDLFAAILADALQIGAATAQRIARDASGEAILIAARSLRIEPAVLHRILLFINPAIGHSVERVYELANLSDELTEQNALIVLDQWRSRPAAPAIKRTAAYQSAYYHDERHSARSAATPATHRDGQRGDVVPGRLRGNSR